MTTSPVRSGIIGTGFMGRLHAGAVRAAGGTLVAVAGARPDAALLSAQRLLAERGESGAAALIASDDIDVVHICTPNHLHAELAELAIAAGKHVICEKPLATDGTVAARLVELAAAAGVVATVPFVYRFYPAVREARARVGRGDAGDIRVVHGSYLQDWLADPTASNWRVDPALGGRSRAFGDIGVHWCDLVQFVSGHRITRLSSRLLTAHPDRSPALPATEDVAVVIFETDRGALGTVVISQVTHGRKNRLWLSVDGTDSSMAFDQELPDSLWVGGPQHNMVVMRGAVGTAEAAQRYDSVPAGHPQGYQDCFNSFVSDTYEYIRTGIAPDGLPTFTDGWRAATITDAVLASADQESWVAAA